MHGWCGGGGETVGRHKIDKKGCVGGQTVEAAEVCCHRPEPEDVPTRQEPVGNGPVPEGATEEGVE